MSRPSIHLPARWLVAVIVATAAICVPLGALASHQFPDVPDSNPFHADIDALVDSGVTSGCGGGKYCPSANVTREQMAAFLNRLGALAPGKTPVVNADKVDGRHANGLVRAAHAQNPVTTGLSWSNSAYVDYLTVTLNAPTAGFVVVNASTSARATVCTQTCGAITYVVHTESASESYPSITAMPIVGTVGSMSVATMFAVEAGANHFVVKMARSNIDSTVDAWFGEANAVFVPFDYNGLANGGVIISSGPGVDPLTKQPLTP